MDKLQVAIELPKECGECPDPRDPFHEPVMPTDLAEILHRIEGKHPKYVLIGMIEGTIQEKGWLGSRIAVDKSGAVVGSNVGSIEPGGSTFQDVITVRVSGLEGTVMSEMTLYSRKCHPEYHPDV